MLWLVDCKKDDIIFTSIDTENGQVYNFSLFPQKTTFNVMSQMLIINILKNKPKQIIFDKSYCGEAFYEAFVDQIKHITSVSMKLNGELSYK